MARSSSWTLKDLSAAEIRRFDSKLFTTEEKDALIRQLYGNPSEWSWKRTLATIPLARTRWAGLTGSDNWEGMKFSLTHNELKLRANLDDQSRTVGSVSDFTDWIYRLYVPKKDFHSLMLGASAEKQIALRNIPIPKSEQWKLIHRGMGENPDRAKTISKLKVKGISLTGSPDLVFRNKRSGAILIVEVKVTRAAIPSDGWPNLKAQLWAYSMIDDWSSAPNIQVVAEIWRLLPDLHPEKYITYDLADKEFQLINSELFEIYGGERHA